MNNKILKFVNCLRIKISMDLILFLVLKMLTPMRIYFS